MRPNCVEESFLPQLPVGNLLIPPLKDAVLAQQSRGAGFREIQIHHYIFQLHLIRSV
jgi:hypothetical protein